MMNEKTYQTISSNHLIRFAFGIVKWNSNSVLKTSGVVEVQMKFSQVSKLFKSYTYQGYIIRFKAHGFNYKEKKMITPPEEKCKKKMK